MDGCRCKKSRGYGARIVINGFYGGTGLTYGYTARQQGSMGWERDWDGARIKTVCELVCI